jgi:hypothetical protein
MVFLIFVINDMIDIESYTHRQSVLCSSLSSIPLHSIVPFAVTTTLV